MSAQGSTAGAPGHLSAADRIRAAVCAIYFTSLSTLNPHQNLAEACFGYLLAASPPRCLQSPYDSKSFRDDHVVYSMCARATGSVRCFLPRWCL